MKNESTQVSGLSMSRLLALLSLQKSMPAFVREHPGTLITIAYLYSCATGILFVYVLSGYLGVHLLFYFTLEDYLLSAVHRDHILFFNSITLLALFFVLLWIKPFKWLIFSTLILTSFLFPVLDARATYYDIQKAFVSIKLKENNTSYCIESFRQDWEIHQKLPDEEELIQLAPIGVDVLKNYIVAIDASRHRLCAEDTYSKFRYPIFIISREKAVLIKVNIGTQADD